MLEDLLKDVLTKGEFNGREIGKFQEEILLKLCTVTALIYVLMYSAGTHSRNTSDYSWRQLDTE
jgi:hypothetical protein